jgi:L-alanine-DL-glutamate epimerase-like enolase superfamily enzyme
MKINKVEIIPVDIPQKAAFRTSAGAPTAGRHIIIKLVTDEGVEGVGNSNSFSNVGVTPESAMIIMKNIASQALLGQDPMNTDLLLNKVESFLGENMIGENAKILAHFDHALYDLKGKILDVPVYQLLGGLCREKIPLECIVILDEPAAQAEIALKFVSAGFHSLKIHPGTDYKMAVNRFKAVRDAVGPDVPLSIDLAGVWRAHNTLKLIRELSQYNLNFAEDPVFPNDIDGFMAVRNRTTVPLVADRDARSIDEAFHLIQHRAADSFHCLIGKVGGLRKAAKYVNLIEAAGLDYQVCMMGTGISHAAGAHFAVSLSKKEGFHDELGLILYTYGATETKDIATDVTKEINGKIEKGYLYPPKGPGLGIELNEEMVKRYASPGINKIIVE